MDTNQNIHVNSFTKGMNSDTSYDMLGADQYLFGQNIRITNNTLIAQAANSNTTEGIVTPVPRGKTQEQPVLTRERVISTKTGLRKTQKEEGESYTKILATASIGNTGAIILANVNTWDVYRADYDNGKIELTLVFSSGEKTEKDRFSVVMNRETEDLLKLYIADGIKPVMCILLNDEAYYENIQKVISDSKYNITDCLSSNRIFPYNKPKLYEISGQLKTQQVQYAYRYYYKNGITSRMSPLTNKINVIGSNRNREVGNAEDTVTDIGFRVTIPFDNFTSAVFNHIQLFRISYIKYNQQPEIHLIFDKPFSGTQIEINDDGLSSLAQYTLDEFQALNTQTIVPQVIQQNQQYLFAGKLEDQTVLGHGEDSVKNEIKRSVDGITYQFVQCNIKLDDSGYSKGPYINNPTKSSERFSTVFVDSNHTKTTEIPTSHTIQSYFESCGVDYTDSVSYNEIFTSSLLRSLRRDEKYRYGIVYYDIYGRQSYVQRIRFDGKDELEVPTVGDLKTITRTDDHAVYAKPLGLKLNIPKPKTGNVVGYQIVRCEKTDNYLKNLFQVALSRPMRQGKYNQDSYRTPYYPNVYLSTNFFYTAYGTTYTANSEHSGKTVYGDIWQQYFDKSGTNVENITLYQAFCPEINIQRNESLSRIKGYTTVLRALQYYCEGRDISESVGQLEYNEVTQPQSDIIKYAFTSYDADTRYDYYSNSNAFIYDDASIVDGSAYFTINPGLSGTQDGGQTFSTIICIPLGYSVTSGSFVTVDGSQVQWDDYVYKHVNEVIGNVNYAVYVSKKRYTKRQMVTVNVDRVVRGICLQEISDESHWKSQLDKLHNGYVHPIVAGVYLSVKYQQNVQKSYKSEQTAIMKLYKPCIDLTSSVSIKNTEDVKNPNQENGFSNIQLTGSEITGIIKQYKSYSTTIGSLQYVNWVANGMYDLAAIKSDTSTQLGNEEDNMRVYTYPATKEYNEFTSRAIGAHGWIGPGPVCLLLNTEEPSTTTDFCSQIGKRSANVGLGTIVANIQHDTLKYDDYSPYYGFGNFRTFDDSTTQSECIVFDGDVYITPAEFVNMFKMYDFNDTSTTIDSGQMVYYIPLESKINTYFDYGHNYRNTSSKNLLLEPGQISGICVQDRPLHQYNMVYSDNSLSYDAYYTQTEEAVSQVHGSRVGYSQLKTNGENIDNWHIFKPADYIDTDTRYGAVTNLLTSNDTLYYWQEQAFGKLSVNERSLVKDENSNTIQLGQGGVLQRTDYLSTHYGMREQDYSAIAAENGIYWIDLTNKAIVAYNQGVVNYGEILNVQNIVNERMTDEKRPTIDYDLQNYELVCNCLKDNQQLVFNLKLNAATSVYTRPYNDSIYFNNEVYGLMLTPMVLTFTQYNYLDKNHEPTYDTTKLSFVVNNVSSQTKTYDNQKVVTLNRGFNVDPNTTKTPYDYFTNKDYTFTTDIYSTNNKPECRTDREGNIIYDIPRVNDGFSRSTDWGWRMRGKWMKVDIVDNDPKVDYCISHVITKVRQSYS